MDIYTPPPIATCLDDVARSCAFARRGVLFRHRDVDLHPDAVYQRTTELAAYYSHVIRDTHPGRLYATILCRAGERHAASYYVEITTHGTPYGPVERSLCRFAGTYEEAEAHLIAIIEQAEQALRDEVRYDHRGHPWYDAMDVEWTHGKRM